MTADAAANPLGTSLGAASPIRGAASWDIYGVALEDDPHSRWRALRESSPVLDTGGGVFFTGQLLPLLRFPLDFDYIHATRYGAATAGGSIDWRVAPPAAVRDRTVLVLDDILDAGSTMSAIRDRILGQGARAFFCAVLTDKVLDKPKPIAADFTALRIPNRFVFGCGMDARGFWRNLPAVYALKEE